MSRFRTIRFCQGLVTATSLLALSGCASFGGNVRGSFSCSAPDGICAPSSVIDDRALALLSSDPSDAPAPNGEPNIRNSRSSRTAALQPARGAAADAGRTQEKVLRIVFQPYIDERGRLHEASAVHAVVARGDWQQQALADLPVLPSPSPGAQPSLAEAVDRFDPPATAGALSDLSDPFTPDPAAVAAARAKTADPIDAIRSDVRARLAPRRTGTVTASVASPATPAAPTAAVPPASPAPANARAGSSAPLAALPPPVSSLPGKEPAAATMARVKADPLYRAQAIGAATNAKAAAQAGLPAPAAPRETVKAGTFPAGVSEDR